MQNNEILIQKIALPGLSETFFRFVLTVLEAEIRRSVKATMAWKTLYRTSSLPGPLPKKSDGHTFFAYFSRRYDVSSARVSSGRRLLYTRRRGPRLIHVRVIVGQRRWIRRVFFATPWTRNTVDRKHLGSIILWFCVCWVFFRVFFVFCNTVEVLVRILIRSKGTLI